MSRMNLHNLSPLLFAAVILLGVLLLLVLPGCQTTKHPDGSTSWGPSPEALLLAEAAISQYGDEVAGLAIAYYEAKMAAEQAEDEQERARQEAILGAIVDAIERVVAQEEAQMHKTRAGPKLEQWFEERFNSVQ